MPGAKEVHVDQPLSEFMFGYRAMGLVADLIFPRVPVKKTSDKVPYWKKGDLLRPVPDVVADMTEANTVDFATGDVTYNCQKHALKVGISDTQRDNAANEIDLERGEVQGVTDLIDLNREVRVAAAVAASGAASAAASAKWSAGTTHILADIALGKASVRKGTGGREANLIIIPGAVADAAGAASELATIIKRYAPELLIAGLLPPSLGQMRVGIAGGLYTSSKKGQMETYAEIWSDSVLIAHVASTPSQQVPSFGYTFQKVRQVRRWREDKLEGDFFEAQDFVDEQIVCLDCAYLITDCL